MKQLYCFLTLLLTPFALLAQQPGKTAPQGAAIGSKELLQAGYSCRETPSTYQLSADSVLQGLDKSQVPTGILYDRTAGTAYLDLFNRAHNDLDTSSVQHFLQAYYELRMATY